MSFLRVALLVLSISVSPVVAFAASIEEEVKAAYTAWDAAFNKSDAKAVAAFYSADLLSFRPHTMSLKDLLAWRSSSLAFSPPA